jgi:acyl carrier protein
VSTPEFTTHAQADDAGRDTAIGDEFAASLGAFIESEVSNGDEPVAGDTDLLLTGLVDSLGVVMIVEWIESRLGIAIDPGDVVLEHFQTVDAMVAFLQGG